MASDWLIAAAVVGGGFGLYALWKSKQAAQSSACDSMCKAAGDPGGHTVCVAGCTAAGGVLGALGDLFHTGRPNAQVLKDDAANNDKLNGPIKVPNTKLDPAQVKGVTGSGDTAAGSLPYGLGGNALEYQSGCVPFWGAEGWSLCKQGTIDMWGAEHRLASESADMTEGWRYVTTRPAGRTADDKPGAPVAQHDYHSVRQGSIDPKSPDPTTQGPMKNVDGSATWLIAGEKLTCPHNHAPAMVDEFHFAYPPSCVPVSTTGIQGTGTRGTVDGSTCPPQTGFTWDVTATGTWYLRRLRVGETTQRCYGGATAPTKPIVGASGSLAHAFP